MTIEEKELLLTVARILRGHLSDTINQDFKYANSELMMLRAALKPFESNVVELKPDGEKK